MLAKPGQSVIGSGRSAEKVGGSTFQPKTPAHRGHLRSLEGELIRSQRRDRRYDAVVVASPAVVDEIKSPVSLDIAAYTQVRI